MKLFFIGLTVLAISVGAVADSKPLMKCGPFVISSSDDGFAHINNARPESQKVTFLGKKDDYSNIQYQWVVQRADAPGWLGMDYIKRDGKAILNVEAIRSNMDQPRVFGTYDCKKVS
ncbi:MAG TPA: hypothetical protein DCM44_00740 [Pantoea sp.]|uniref:hypothetical protein n=1 Tax=Pantoea TaxID=53335 RepID=UPI000EC89752|nr:hypothetical protein [Pantoea septica]HAK33504.1 hypothetical protein [Pantoea sp.]